MSLVILVLLGAIVGIAVRGYLNTKAGRSFWESEKDAKRKAEKVAADAFWDAKRKAGLAEAEKDANL